MGKMYFYCETELVEKWFWTATILPITALVVSIFFHSEEHFVRIFIGLYPLSVIGAAIAHAVALYYSFAETQGYYAKQEKLFGTSSPDQPFYVGRLKHALVPAVLAALVTLWTYYHKSFEQTTFLVTIVIGMICFVALQKISASLVLSAMKYYCPDREREIDESESVAEYLETQT